MTLGRGQGRDGARVSAAAPVTLPPYDLDESTRPGDSANAPLHLTDAMLNDLAEDVRPRRSAVEDHSAHDEATRMASLDGIAALERASHASQAMPAAPRSEGSPPPRNARKGRPLTRQQPQPVPPPSKDPTSANEERTRAVDIRHDKSISDIDWDLD
jgi:hypothetical protein